MLFPIIATAATLALVWGGIYCFNEGVGIKSDSGQGLGLFLVLLGTAIAGLSWYAFGHGYDAGDDGINITAASGATAFWVCAVSLLLAIGLWVGTYRTHHSTRFKDPQQRQYIVSFWVTGAIVASTAFFALMLGSSLA